MNSVSHGSRAGREPTGPATASPAPEPSHRGAQPARRTEHYKLKLRSTVTLHANRSRSCARARRPTCRRDAVTSTPMAVTHGTGTFELEAPDAAEMARRRDDVLAKGLPWLVAEQRRPGAGLCLRQPLPPAAGLPLQRRGLDLPAPRGPGPRRRARAAGRAGGPLPGGRRAPDAGGDRRQRQRGFESACIGRWASSVAVVLQSVGWKFGRWLDVVLMQRPLGAGSGGAGRCRVKRPRSKTLATWLAVIGGAFGAHRFYLHGWRDLIAWLYPLPTLLGLAGVQRMRAFGQDDRVAWVLIPLLGLALSAAMLSAIVYGLTPDDKWAVRPTGQPPQATGWAPVLGVIIALLIGSSVLMGTVAFSGQRFFEWQLEQSADRP